MSRKYTKVEHFSEEVFRRKALGETNRELAESFGLTREQIKELVKRQNRKARLIAAGYIPRLKGRPRRNPGNGDQDQSNEIIRLRMHVELLQNFLSEVGRR